ncbi:sarcosine oxidase subunit gamma [Loktanella agnita]|uniref:sarcosine oxidase subunit gamma n=1 Tax=Loktanella agnita TaxID=287097 RepID=UPI003988784D
MSEPISALQGKFAPGEVTIREDGLQGMITLRGDLSGKSLRSVCKAVTGQPMPKQGTVSIDGGKGICWMSPDELLLLVPYADVGSAIKAIDKALKGKHYLAENVSDARALIRVEGTFAHEVIAKLAPVDLHPVTFQPDDFRRTRLGQVAAAFWMRDEDTFQVICFRSVAAYAFDLLAVSAKAGRVGHFPGA